MGININDKELIKLDSENERQYIWRIGQMYDNGLLDAQWDDITNLFNSQLREDDIEWKTSSYAKPYRDAVKYYEDVFKEMLNDKEYINDIDQKKYELQKERYKIQTEKIEINKWLREDARSEMFVEQIINAIKSEKTDCKNINYIKPIKNSKEHALFMADAHFGKEFKIYGLNDEIINEYSPEIFYNRMDNIFSETVEYIKKEKVNLLKIFNLGDNLDGYLRASQIWTLRYGVVDSAIIYGKYMAKWLKELSKEVIIEYYPTSGNHGELRLLDGKKDEHVNDNAEKFINEIICVKNEENPNFKLITNKTGLIFTEIAGFNLLGIHGEVKNSSQALKDFSDIYDTKLNFLAMGHKHHGNFINCGYRKQTIGIGSIVGSDDFSMKIKKQADATANLITFEVGKGKVNDYTIYLN